MSEMLFRQTYVRNQNIFDEITPKIVIFLNLALKVTMKRCIYMYFSGNTINSFIYLFFLKYLIILKKIKIGLTLSRK